MDWELYEAEKLLDWMLPRQRRLLRTLVRAQELNAMQLRRSARQRLRNGGVRDKAGGEVQGISRRTSSRWSGTCRR